MSLWIERRCFRLWIGPDMCRALPAGFYVGWCVPDWREKAQQSPFRRIEHVWAIQASWEWLPTLVRVCHHWRWRWRTYNAAAWTGRDFEVVGCRWDICGSLTIGRWHKGFSVGRLWGPEWL